MVDVSIIKRIEQHDERKRYLAEILENYGKSFSNQQSNLNCVDIASRR